LPIRAGTTALPKRELVARNDALTYRDLLLPRVARFCRVSGLIRCANLRLRRRIPIRAADCVLKRGDHPTGRSGGRDRIQRHGLPALAPDFGHVRFRCGAAFHQASAPFSVRTLRGAAGRTARRDFARRLALAARSARCAVTGRTRNDDLPGARLLADCGGIS
jgi:hypothetical protein